MLFLAEVCLKDKIDEIDGRENARIKGDDNSLIRLADPEVVEHYRNNPSIDTWKKVKLSAKNNPEFSKKTLYVNDQVYAARNEAMEALEEERVYQMNKDDAVGRIMDRVRFDAACEGLKACRKCFYEEPRIVKVVEEGKKYE